MKGLFRTIFSVLWMPVAVYTAQQLRMWLYPGHYQLDVIAHFLGGFAIAYGTFRLIEALPKKLTGYPFTPFTFFVAIIFSTVFVGVAWEWYEWLAFHGTTGSYDGIVFSQWYWWTDTLNDLVMDTLGAIICTSVIMLARKNR